MNMNDSAEIDDVRSELRATLARIKAKGKTGKLNEDSKLFLLKTRMARRAFTEEDLKASG